MKSTTLTLLLLLFITIALAVISYKLNDRLEAMELHTAEQEAFNQGLIGNQILLKHYLDDVYVKLHEVSK